MNDFYHHLPLAEKDRVEKLEVFDEYEELESMCHHYQLILAASMNLSEMIGLLLPSRMISDYPLHGPCYVKELEIVSNLSSMSRYIIMY